ncbi:MAG: c-type cytochrome, partial [Bacteroidota bacterium]
MHFKTNKKIVVTAMLCMAMVAAQTFAQKEHDEKPKNLKVLPKDIGGEELHNMMRDFSKSLGVKCSYCHVSQDMGEGQRPKFDFAADDKPEKGIAREMIKMVSAINSNYLAQIK